MKLRVLPLSVACALLLASHTFALPRFASRTGAKCQSCHVNPSGAGMRQAFGVQYGREQLPLPALSHDFEVEDFSNILTNVLGVGADFRTLYFSRQQGGANGFFQMQGDVYLNFRVAKKVSMYLSKGLYSGFEIFGLLNVLPANGSIKVGKFIPNYGIKMDDHTAYIRMFTGFSPELGRPELTGGEVAVSPGPFTVVGGFYNAVDGFGAATGNHKAVLGRAEAMINPGEDMHVGLGANIFNARRIPGNTTTLIGGFGSFSLDQLTVFGEADLIQSKADSTITGVVAYIEADYTITPGLDLKVAYDFYDPNKDVKSGAQSRYSFGFEFFLIAGVEVRPMYRIVKDQPVELKNDEFHLVIHFYL
jgi:hypothetical protein